MGLSSINVNNIDTNVQPVKGVLDHSQTVSNTTGGVPMIPFKAAVTTFSKWVVESGPGTIVNADVTLDAAGTVPVYVRSFGLNLPVGDLITFIISIQSAFGAGNSEPTAALYSGQQKIGDITLTDGGPSVATTLQFVPLDKEIRIEFNYGGGEGDDVLTLTSTQVSTPLNANTTHVMWTLDGADARFTLDGSAPTSTNGHWVSDKSSGIWHKNTAVAAKWIRAASTNAYLHITEVTH
jgi:hypothetical protein